MGAWYIPGGSTLGELSLESTILFDNIIHSGASSKDHDWTENAGRDHLKRRS